MGIVKKRKMRGERKKRKRGEIAKRKLEMLKNV